MKKTLFILLSLMATHLHAQDVIIKKDDSTILAKVLEVDETSIKYKKYSNQSGPTYTISIANVRAINYQNGEKDTFDNAATPSDKKESTQSSSASQQYVDKSPASNNQDLIQQYNSDLKFTLKYKGKDSKWFFPVMGVSDSSLLATDELEMKFVPVRVFNQNICDSYHLRYYIELTNKTNNIIYVDLANTFRIYTDGDSKTYFNADQIAVSHGSGTGVGVGLGGIAGALGIGGTLGTLAGAVTVGGSTQHSVTTTYNQQRILAIPPHSTKNLSEYKQVHVKKKTYKTISDAERWSFYLHHQRGVVKKGGYVSYTEKTTPYTNRYIITYSTSQDFSNYSMLHAKVYARYILGEYQSNYFSNPKSMIKDLQKFIPDLWTNPGVLVGESSYLSK